MKCPICGKQMKIGMLDPEDSWATVWMSIMPCSCVCSYGASKAVWQEFIRTRKALDVIKKEIHKETMPDFAVIRDALKGVSDD